MQKFQHDRIPACQLNAHKIHFSFWHYEAMHDPMAMKHGTLPSAQDQPAPELQLIEVGMVSDRLTTWDAAQMSPQVYRSARLQIQIYYEGPQSCRHVFPGGIPHRGTLPPRKRRCNQCSCPMNLMEMLHIEQPGNQEFS